MDAEFYDDLDLSLAKAAELIADGARQRNAPAHCPVVATIDANRNPSQRVMILRDCDWAQRLLRFHTDGRSEKCAEISRTSAASVLFYDAQAKIQLRLLGTARIENDSVIADKAWAQATPFARRCYLTEKAPGQQSDVPSSGLPKAMEGRQPEEAELIPGRANFAVMLFTFDQIEWLYLANSGHRRAHWRWDSLSSAWQGWWQIP
jgi:pyridoxamine 5'-phosphate oxidase